MHRRKRVSAIPLLALALVASASSAGHAQDGVTTERALIGAPPRILINTHWHHAFANAGFGTDAVIVAHAATRDRLRRSNWMSPHPRHH